MFAFLKKLFGQQPAPAPAVAATPRSQPAAPAVTTPARHNAPVPAPASASPSPKPAPPAPKPATAPAPRPALPEPIAFSKETVDLPLKPLWSKLSAEVTQCASTQPSGDSELRLPLNLVQAHLAKGAMKIPLVQFRQFSTPGIFPENHSRDALEVVIPISEILPRLRPDQLPRRAGQRRIEVPDDIEPIFGPKGAHNLRISQDKSKPAPAAAAAPAPVTVKPAEESHETNIFTRVASAKPAPAPPAPEPVAESPEPIISPIAAVPPAAPAAPAPVTPLAPEPAVAAPAAPPPDAGPIRAPKLDPSLATLRPKAPSAPVVPPPVPARTEPTFDLALSHVAGFWASRGRIELEPLSHHHVHFPVSFIKTALRKGKVEFPWRELKPWVSLASGSSLPDIADEAKIEFPLSVIAPRFMEMSSHGAPRKRIQISDEIPDVFVRNEPAPAPAPEPAPQPESVQESAPRDLGEIFGQPGKKEWSLGEISQRTSSLPGVAGAIIATTDGLLVGGSWPGAVGTEAVAAFVPQIYSRLTNYTSELQLGNPADLTLLVENVPLRIFKSAHSYFTVLGRAGESLPDLKLKAIATRLAETATEYEPKAN